MKQTLMMQGYCFVCGGNGFLDTDCPSCGREARNKSLNLDKRQDTEEFVKKIDSFGIPELYRGVIWNGDILRESKQSQANNHNFERFVQQLEKVNQVFTGRLLSRKSAIIIAPAGYSKMTLAYSCMQRALDNGFSVAPLLDTVEAKRLLVLASENPSYRLYGNILYDDYIMADVMFLTVTKLGQRAWAYETIQEVLDRRSRKGLGTFILSRYDLEDISRKDYANQFSVIATAVSDDSYKYPAVIRYREFGCQTYNFSA